jgi:hypothetical protein
LLAGSGGSRKGAASRDQDELIEVTLDRGHLGTGDCAIRSPRSVGATVFLVT